MTLRPTFEDITDCETVLFEWAESYDGKDWERLERCIAPSLRIDYRAFVNKLWENMAPADFVAMVSHPHFLGTPRIQTQHFIGMTKWEKVSETQILGHHQMRVAHQKHADDELKEVTVKGHSHGTGTITYRRIDGVWKFAGIEPHVRWTEFGGEGLFGPPVEEGNTAPGPINIVS